MAIIYEDNVPYLVCDKCGKLIINTLQTGYCSKCIREALHGNGQAAQHQVAADGAYSCACGDVFPETPFCLVCGDRAFTPRR